MAQPLPPVTEVLSLVNARALCHLVVDRWGLSTLTATSLERGGSVTTQRRNSESPWNREAVAAWAVEALVLEDVREVAYVQRGNGYVLLFR